MKKIALAALAFAFPVVTFAQTNVNSVQDVGTFIIDLINNIAIPLLFAVAFLVFIYGIFEYFIRGASNEEKRKEGLSIILYGLIGFAVMVSVWGLVRILTGTVRLDNSQTQLPRAAQTR